MRKFTKYSAGFVAATLAATLGALFLTSCASISESECQAGNWADLGYRDGVNGKSRSRIADYVETCGEYGASVDRSAYLSSFETGLIHYCTYDKGFELGKDGSSYNSVCGGQLADAFRAGYDEGYSEYEIRKKYDKFESDIEDTEAEIQDVKDRLADSAIEPDETDRLRKKKKRLLRDLEELRWDFRSFRRKYDLDIGRGY